MRHRPMRQRWALALLRATTGADLTRLKAFIDDGGCVMPLRCWQLLCCCTLPPAPTSKPPRCRQGRAAPATFSIRHPALLLIVPK